MICPKCNSNVNEGSTFCMNCGANLSVTQPVQQTPSISEVPVQPVPTPSISEVPVQQVNEVPVSAVPVQPAQNVSVQPAPTPVNNASVSGATLNYLMYLLTTLLKPFKNFKDEESKLANPGTALVLTAIVSGIMTIITTIMTVLSVVRVGSFSFSDGFTTKWEWSNLKEVKWLQTIGGGFLTGAGIVLAITVVFYLGSLIIKKQLNFAKALSISATAMIPMIAGTLILAPLGGIVWEPLSIIFGVSGVVYSLVIFHELMNNQLDLEKDVKIYFNLACYGILILGLYFVSMEILESSISDLFSMFD